MIGYAFIPSCEFHRQRDLSMFPDLPLEFVVPGTATSRGAKRAASRERWQESVRDAAKKVLPAGHFLLDTPVAVTIYFFPQAEMQADIDNSAKPILDAMSRLIYLDDRQVDRIVVQKFEPGRPFEIRDEPTDCLAVALAAEDPIVYIKVKEDLGGE